MTDDDITRLRELAQAATADDLLRMVVQVDTILALLSRLESAERERDEARADMHAAWKSAHDNAAKFVDAEAERDALAADARRYRLLRRGQHWSVIDGIGDTLRAEALDAAIDAALAAKEQSK